MNRINHVFQKSNYIVLLIIFLIMFFIFFGINGKNLFDNSLENQEHSIRSFNYATILTTHPKIYICPDNKDEIIGKAFGSMSSVHRNIENWATRHELYNRDYNPEKPGGMSSTYMLEVIFICSYLYQITGDNGWGNTVANCRDFLVGIDKYWTSPTDNAATLEALALGFDLAYDRIVTLGLKNDFINDIIFFAEREKQTVIDELYTDYHNYFIHKITAILFAGLALYGENDKAIEYLDFALNCFWGNNIDKGTVASLHFVNGEGTWEGSTYARQSLWHLSRFISAWETGNNNKIDLINGELSDFINAGYGIMYHTRPDKFLCKIGDTSYPWLHDKDAFTLWFLQGKKRDPYLTWFCKNTFIKNIYGTKISPTVSIDNTYWRRQPFAMIWWDPNVIPQNVEELPLARKFKNSGEIIMKSRWNDPNETYIMFKSPSFHFGGHLHLDQNSFTIFKNGPLAIDSGFWSRNQEHNWNYYKRSTAHNTITIMDSDYLGVHGNRNKKYFNDGGYRFVWAKHYPPYITQRGWANEPRWLPDGSIRALTADQRDDFFMGFSKHRFSNNYDYCWGDATSSFTNKYTGKGDNEPVRVKSFQREFVYLRPDYVIVFDRVKSVKSSNEKKWLLHSIDAPKLFVGGEWITPPAGVNSYQTDLSIIDTPIDRTFGNNRGRLFHKILLPVIHLVKTVGGSNYEFWIDGKNWPINDPRHDNSFRKLEDPGEWRIEIIPKDINADVFLNVFFVTTADLKIMPETELIKSESGNKMYGAHIKSAEKERLVMFSYKNESVQAFSYSIKTDCEILHLLCNLSPNQSYNILRNGIKVSSVVATDVGTIQYTDNRPGFIRYEFILSNQKK